MGEEEKCPGKQLDFNAPILSLRQPTHINRSRRCLRFSRVASWDASSNRVPFSWEQIPGKPKETETTIWDSLRDDIPTPKLPPGRRHPLLKEVLNGGIIEQQQQHHQQQQHIDDGCDADNEEEDHTDEANHSTISFQALDIFSLCESVDNVEQGDSRTVEEEWHSANFMIQRFLPDARALAAASSIAAAKIIYGNNKNNNVVCSSNCVKVGKLNHSSKNCGLDHFFPWWRMKPKLCRGKNTANEIPSKLTSHYLCTRNIQKQAIPDTPRTRRNF